MFQKSMPVKEKEEILQAIKSSPTLRIDYPEKGTKVWVVGDAEIVKIVARRMTDNAADCAKFIEANGKLPDTEIAAMQERHTKLCSKRTA